MENNKIIISVTTIPSRINHLLPVFESIKNQTIKADEIVLVLPLKSLREQKDANKDPYTIPENLNSYIKTNNITILRPEYDYGPIMKMLPVILREKQNKTDNIVISIDDDKIYFNNTIEDLINGYKRNNCVCARKGSVLNMTSVRGKIKGKFELKVKENPLRSADFTEDKQINFIYGTGGVLYKPSFFKDNIFAELTKLYKAYRQPMYVDDVVIAIFLMMNNIKMFLVKTTKNEFQKNHDNVKCGIMDPSTVSQNINRLAALNYANSSHNNIFTLTLYKQEIVDYAYKNKIVAE